MKDLRKIVLQIPTKEFAPTPEEYLPQLQHILKVYGEHSAEAASAYMQMGDAASLQGNHRAPEAVAYYQKALDIHRSLDENSLETAWSCDKLSAGKHALQDYPGAAESLSRAMDIWMRLVQAGSDDVDADYVNRRQETLQILQRMAAQTG